MPALTTLSRYAWTAVRPRRHPADSSSTPWTSSVNRASMPGRSRASSARKSSRTTSSGDVLSAADIGDLLGGSPAPLPARPTLPSSATPVSPYRTSRCAAPSAARNRGGAHPHGPAHALGQVPVPVAQQLHRGRHEDGPHDRRVEQHRGGEPEAELLQADEAAGEEAPEGRDHDDRRRRDDAAGV